MPTDTYNLSTDEEAKSALKIRQQNSKPSGEGKIRVIDPSNCPNILQRSSQPEEQEDGTYSVIDDCNDEILNVKQDTENEIKINVIETSNDEMCPNSCDTTNTDLKDEPNQEMQSNTENEKIIPLTTITDNSDPNLEKNNNMQSCLTNSSDSFKFSELTYGNCQSIQDSQEIEEKKVNNNELEGVYNNINEGSDDCMRERKSSMISENNYNNSSYYDPGDYMSEVIGKSNHSNLQRENLEQKDNSNIAFKQNEMVPHRELSDKDLHSNYRVSEEVISLDYFATKTKQNKSKKMMALEAREANKNIYSYDKDDDKHEKKPQKKFNLIETFKNFMMKPKNTDLWSESIGDLKISSAKSNVPEGASTSSDQKRGNMWNNLLNTKDTLNVNNVPQPNNENRRRINTTSVSTKPQLRVKEQCNTRNQMLSPNRPRNSKFTIHSNDKEHLNEGSVHHRSSQPGISIKSDQDCNDFYLNSSNDQKLNQQKSSKIRNSTSDNTYANAIMMPKIPPRSKTSEDTTYINK